MARHKKSPKHNKPIKLSRERRLSNFNAGVGIFAFMLLYIIGCIITFFTQGHVSRYQVKNGSLSLSNVYTGLIVRDETLFTAGSSGYINYFAHEGEHLACGDLIYSLDQTGHISDIVQNGSTEELLSGNDLYELRSEFIDFAHNYNDKSYSLTYDFSYDVLGTVLKLTNYNMLNNLQSSEYRGAVDFFYAPQSGVIVYNTDGYEGKAVSDITFDDLSDDFDSQKTQMANNTLVGNGDKIYKMITSEYWSVVIAVDNNRIPQLEEAGYVEVKFLKNQNKSWAKVNVLQTGEKQTLVELQLNNSMITFAKERFIDIEVILENENGLKIPNSAIAEKEFYLIPKEFAVTDEKGNVKHFMREVYDEEGNVSTEKLEVSIYSESDTDYYVDTFSLRTGDYICKPDSMDKYPISKIGTLIGVYNINKGFADFKEITILYQNDEYSIVKSNTNYGLVEYDYIVLDAASINEDDFINE